MVTPNSPAAGDFQPGQQVTEVVPGSPNDPFSVNASTQSPQAPSAPVAGAPAGEPGATGDAIDPAALPPARPVLAPPPVEGTPAPVQPAAPAAAAPAAPVQEPQAPAPAPATAPAQPAPAAEPVQAPTQAAPVQAPASAPVIDAEQIRQEAREKAEADFRVRQSGIDRRMNEVTQQSEALKVQLAANQKATRDLILKGVPESERTVKLKEWELEDAQEEVEALKNDTISYGQDVEMGHLLLEYTGVPGVTEEALRDVPLDERELWCKDQKLAHLQKQLANPQQPAAAAAPAQPAPVPPGATAASDVGGGGTPPAQAPTRDEGQNPDAMAANIGQGWQRGTRER